MPQKGQCFLQFLHSSRPGSTRFGASIECWKRCFQGYEYKKYFANFVEAPGYCFRKDYDISVILQASRVCLVDLIFMN
jgi:hypothetical protein